MIKGRRIASIARTDLKGSHRNSTGLPLSKWNSHFSSGIKRTYYILNRSSNWKLNWLQSYNI